MDALRYNAVIGTSVGLRRFVAESNRIEGINRDPTQREIDAHAVFLSLRTITVADMEAFVRDVAEADLRRERGMNVRVGSHFPPSGGPTIETELKNILVVANVGDWTPFDVHREYEGLHPFMDGNGRSGRALWAWQMLRDGEDPFALPFLHRWYYQSLEDARLGA